MHCLSKKFFSFDLTILRAAYVRIIVQGGSMYSVRMSIDQNLISANRLNKSFCFADQVKVEVSRVRALIKCHQ